MIADKYTEGQREGCRGGKLQTILAVGLIPIERNDSNDSNRYAWILGFLDSQTGE